MLDNSADGQLLQGGEWDSPLKTPLNCPKDDGKVCGGGEQCVGGAEPLLHHRLLLAGHHECNRPSGILTRLMKEEILTGIEVDVSEMRKKEDYLEMPGADG